MLKPGHHIWTETDLKKAKLTQQPVLVKYEDNGEIADYGGPIEEINEIAVKINGTYYTKAVCRFFVRKGGAYGEAVRKR
jgi:hypothetical protein